MIIDLQVICPINIPQSIYEEIETIVNVYNLMIEDDNLKEAKRYFIDRIETLKYKSSEEEKQYYNKVYLNYISSM